MINWQNTAAAVVAQVDRELPTDADLRTRKAALRKAWPWEFGSTSWGRKVRAKYTREYLARYGQPAKQPTPLEAAIERASR